MMWTLFTGLLAYTLAWMGISYSETIRSDEGQLYQFSPRIKKLTALLGAGMAMFLSRQAFSKVEWLLMVFIGVLMSLQFVIDFSYKELANEWNGALAVSGVSLVLFQGSALVQTRLIAWGILTFFFFFWWVFSTGLGFGDVKFVAATSFLLTANQVMPYLVWTLSLAIVYGGLVMLVQKKGLKTEFAFGPFLILGMLILGIA